MLNLDYYGHSCFSLSDEAYTVLIDPFLTGNPLAAITAAELHPTHILVTHGHNDHFCDALEIAKRTGAMIIAPNELAVYCSTKGAQAHGMNIGGSYQFAFGKVTMTNALHSSAVRVGDEFIYAGNPCGFLIEMQGQLIYHAGDTGLFTDMQMIGERYSVDCALLPIGDNFVMGPVDAAYAASLIKPKLSIPMHYNTFPVVRQDPTIFTNKLSEYGLLGKILKPGEGYVLKR